MQLVRRKKGPSMFMRIIVGAVAMAFAAAIVQSIPDIARYLRIREM